MRSLRSARTALAASTAFAVLAACAWGLSPQWRNDVLAAAVAATLTTSPVSGSVLDQDDASDIALYLVVGSDRRVPEGPAATGPDMDIRGERADSMMVWAVPATAGAVSVLSLPRDLRVHVPDRGDRKLGSVLEYGPDALVGAVKDLTGLPVHHYLEVEFTALTSVIDHLGGVPVTLSLPARDPTTGLALPGGTQVLDGAAALAYARSRHYEELEGTRWVPDGAGDLGRIARQHHLVRSLVETLADDCPSGCLGALQSLGRSVTIDGTFDSGDVRQLIRALRRQPADLETTILPTRPERPAHDGLSPFPPSHLGSIGFRMLDEPAAGDILDGLLRRVGSVDP